MPPSPRWREVQGDQPMVFGVVDAGRGGLGGRRLDRHPDRPDGQGRDPVGPDHRRQAEGARDRPGSCDGRDRQAHPDQPRQARQSQQAGRRVHAVRPVGRRQDRDRACPVRTACSRRRIDDRHQHERVPGGAHRLDAEGRAGGLCRLRPGRRADRGGAAAALFGGAARRGRKGAPRRPRDVLPGVRQGVHERQRRPLTSISRTR